MDVQFFMVVMVVAVAVVEGRQPVLHRVGGGKQTWAPNVNFAEWASHEHFYVGDWLFFGFNKTLYNVLQVNKTSYKKCTDKGFIKNITRGGRDVFNLTDATTYYFLSGHGYCLKGMKVKVHVEYAPLPESISPMAAALGGAPPGTRIALFLVMSLLIVYPLVLNPPITCHVRSEY